MALSKFKYVGGKDKGVNPDKQIILYNIVFPFGKEVEVPDDVAHKLRTKTGRDGDEIVEVHAGADKTHAEQLREQELKDAAKAEKVPEKLTPEDLKDLKAKAAKEDERVAKVRSDAQLGR